MKAFKLLAVAALLAASTTAQAQFTNTSKSSSSASGSNEGWSTFYVQWNPSSINIDVKNADDQSFTGFSLGYNKVFPIASGTPLFIEAGIGLQYSFYTFDSEDAEDMDYDDYGSGDYYGDWENKYNMLSAKVPVSLMYNFRITNSNISIAPYAGIDLRFNIFGKMKHSSDSEYDDEDDDDKNLFDKDDMGSKDNTWKRFQFGWHIGVNARFNDSFLLGVSYGSDFSELYKKAKISTTSITLGYCF